MSVTENAAKYRTKPIRQLFHVKDFTPDGADCWKTETLVGVEPIVLGVTLLGIDSILVDLTEHNIKSVTAMSPLTIKLSKVGVECPGFNKVGRVRRTVHLGLFMGEASCEMDVWTNAPVDVTRENSDTPLV